MKTFLKLIIMTFLLAANADAQMFWNHAAKFEGGTASYIACPNTLSINIVGSVTVEAWVYPTTGSGTRYVVFKGSAGAGYYLRLNTNGTVSFGTNGTNRVTSTATVPPGKWTHIAGTYNVQTDMFRIYIDGGEDGSAMSDNPPAASNDSLYIGKFGASSFTGLIDEIRIWTKEVTSDEIRRNRRTSLSLSSGKYTSLLFSMPFQKPNSAGTTFTLSDLSLNPISGNVGYNRGITPVNLGGAPSDYLNSNESLDLEGNYDSYAALPHNPLNGITGAMTLEAWIFVKGSSAVNQYIFHKHGAGTGYRIMVTNTQKLSFSVNATQFFEGSSTINHGRWYHIAWTISPSGSSSIYVNGVLDAYFAATGVPLANNDSLYIGRGFNGFIDEARVFKFERSAEDIKKSMHTSMDASNMPPGEGFSFNLDGSAWANGGIQFLFLRGNTYFSSPAAVNGAYVSPLIRADGSGFSQGFYRTTNYRRIPQSGTVGSMTDDSIFIPGGPAVTDINVYVALNHGRLNEIEIKLVAPTGQEVTLMNNFNQLDLAPGVSTIFDDQADSSLVSGRYVHISPKIKPQGSLNAVFQGINPQGVWRLKINDAGGLSAGSLISWGLQVNNSPAIGIENISAEIPSAFSLGQNYPNPFNPVTNIEFSLPKNSFTKLTVYDITGRETAVLVNKKLAAGVYKVDFDASHLSSGAYFYRLEAEGLTEIKKMVLVK